MTREEKWYNWFNKEIIPKGTVYTGECAVCGEITEEQGFRTYPHINFKGWIYLCPHHFELTAKYPETIPAKIKATQNKKQ